MLARRRTLSKKNMDTNMAPSLAVLPILVAAAFLPHASSGES